MANNQTQIITSIKRVLIVSYEYPPLGGGGGRMIQDLARGLSAMMQVTVLTSYRKGLHSREMKEGVEVVRVPILGRLRDDVATLASLVSFFPSSLNWGLRRGRYYDLVHSSFAIPSGPAGLLIAKKAHIPHIVTLHGGDLYDPSKKLSPHRVSLLRRTVSWVIRRSDRVIAQSSDIEEKARHIYGARFVDRIPLAVEQCERTSLEVNRILPYCKNAHLSLVTVGRLIARKGLTQLLDIVAGLTHFKVRLFIIGEGPLRASLQQHARALGIYDRVYFMGFLKEDEKLKILESADLYVSTTLHEGFCIAFLEAMRAGLTVVTYDNGGQRDFIDEKTGVLVPAGDKNQFLHNVEGLLQNPELRKRLGDSARKRAMDYGIDRFVQSYLQVYEECQIPKSEVIPRHIR